MCARTRLRLQIPIRTWFSWKVIGPILLIGSVALYIVTPYFTARHVGSGDALFYHNMFTDYLTQTRAGVFPVRIGQTESLWYGAGGETAAIYLFYLGSIIDQVTGKALDPIIIQHLVVILTILLGGYSMYFVTTRIAPKYRWICAVLAILYITNPGILTQLYIYDAYPTLASAALIPLFIYGMLASVERPQRWAIILVAGTLAALWSAHAPIALWCTTICAVFQLLSFIWLPARRQRLMIGVQGALLFLFLFVGYFVATQTLVVAGTNNLYSFSAETYVASVMDNLRSVIPEVFLPLQSNHPLADVQLGYSLWIVLFCCLFFAIRKKNVYLALLLACTGLLLVFLFPIPLITEFLWARLPQFFQITSLWPMERLYPILAALICVAGALCLPYVYRLIQNRWLRTRLFAIMVGAMLALNLAEATKLVRGGFYSQFVGADYPLTTENVITTYTSSLNIISPYYYDPILENRLLNLSNPTIRLISNLKYVSDQCMAQRGLDQLKLWSGDTIKADRRISLAAESEERPVTPVLTFPVKPAQRVVLGFQFNNENFSGRFEFFGGTIRREYDLDKLFTSQQIEQTTGLFLPFWTSGTMATNVSFQFNAVCEPNKSCQASFQSFCYIPYSYNSLPVRVYSYVPYKARVTVSQPVYLETHRLFYPGYEAHVNGQVVPVSVSPLGMAMIPLIAGENDVTLDYVGTPIMNLTFVISLLAWIGVAIYSLYMVRQALRGSCKAYSRKEGSRLEGGFEK